MKILFISGQYPPFIKGGGEISTHLIARALAEVGHTITVLTEGKDYKEEYEDGVQILRMKLGLTQKPLFENVTSRVIAHAINRALNLQAFDIIHAHDFRSGLVLAELIRLKQIVPAKTFVTIRDYAAISGDTNYILRDGTIPKQPISLVAYWNSYRVHETNIFRGVARFLQYAFNTPYRNRAFSRLPNRIYISHAQQREIQRHLARGKVATVIYNPVTLPEFSLHPRTNTVLYAGRVEEYKGVELLLHAWATVISQIDDATLRIAGTGAQLDRYTRLAIDLGITDNVRFLGYIPYKQLQEEYQRMDVLVAPNLWIEPFGRSVAEGLAYGRIVVAAKQGGPGEMVSDGTTGFTYSANHPQDLAAKLLEVLTLEAPEYEHIARAGHTWAVDHLAPQTIAEQYVRFYNEAIKI